MTLKVGDRLKFIEWPEAGTFDAEDHSDQVLTMGKTYIVKEHYKSRISSSYYFTKIINDKGKLWSINPDYFKLIQCINLPKEML